jgi:hypothetical protein
MSRSVLTNAERATFTSASQGKQIDLDVHLVEWTDSRKPRLATHEFLKRDGASIEYMGRSPVTIRFNLIYIGQTWRNDFLQFAAIIDKDPKGKLTHPVFGSINVACQGFDGATMNTETGRDLYLVPVSFIEDNIQRGKDTFKGLSVADSVQSRQQDVENYSSSLTSLVTRYILAGAAIQNLAHQAQSFSVSAFNSYAQATLDPSLQISLAGVAKLAEESVGLINSEINAINDPINYNTIFLIELLYDACSQMFAAISASKPALITYVVPIKMHIANLAATLYGADATGRIDEILSNNPGKIPNPSSILPGTILKVSTPTVIAFN